MKAKPVFQERLLLALILGMFRKEILPVVLVGLFSTPVSAGTPRMFGTTIRELKQSDIFHMVVTFIREPRIMNMHTITM